MKKLIYPITIIIASLILGGSFLMVQSNKQKSIEQQEQVKIEREDKKIADEKEAERLKRISIANCIDRADTEYWNFMELNGDKAEDGTINAETRFWNTAEENKERDIDICYKILN
jgi:hypothetical protein